MGMFTGAMPGLYRHTIDGRRVFRFWSVIPRSRMVAFPIADDVVAIFERRIRRLYVIILFCLVPLLTIALEPTLDLAQLREHWRSLALFLFLPAVIQYIGIRYWALRDIPAIVISSSDLRPSTWRQRELADVGASSPTELIMMLVGSLLLLSGQVFVLVNEGAWWAVMGTLIFGATTIHSARRLYLLSQATRRSPF